MCGRYRLGRGRQAFLKYFGADRDNFDWSPRFNIAPSQQVPTIRQDNSEPRRVLSTMRWGLIPYWAKDPNVGYKMINARSETVTERPAFSEPLKTHRCLIPADGFYEWKKLDGKTKQPYSFTLADESVFAFAGLWDRWTDSQGIMVETCTILTTTPNALTADVHDRMLVILRRDDYDSWLDPGMTRTEDIMSMLKPYAPDEMKRFPVSTRINSVANDDSSCGEPVEVGRGMTATLF